MNRKIHAHFRTETVMLQRHHLKLVALISAFLLSGAAAHGQAVVPASLVNVEGNTNNLYPFACADFAWSSMRYQQVYLGSEVGTGEISALRLRIDGPFGTAFGPQGLDVTIQLSSTMTAHPFGSSGGLSSILADNVGPDVTTVFNGSLDLSSGWSPAAPHPFDIIIPVTPGFFFDSSTGANLLLDVIVPNCDSISTLDAHSEEDDSVARAVAFDSKSPMADFQDTLGLVTKIIFGIFGDGFESGDTSAWSFTEPSS